MLGCRDELGPIRAKPTGDVEGTDEARLSDGLVAVGEPSDGTAEVTLGGVDTQGLSSTTMESKLIPGLHFIGEVVDVTGHLGGYNFQWAWASGQAAGEVA